VPDRTSSRMIREIFTLGCLLALGQAGVREKIMRDINEFNSNYVCWGGKNTVAYNVAMIEATEQCMQYGSPAANVKPTNPFALLTQGKRPLPQPIGNRWESIFSTLLERNKRQAEAGLLETDEQDQEEFLEDLASWKGDLASKIGNLTCVLTKLDVLDSNMQINMNLYTSKMWEQMDLSETLAGEDSEWREMMITGYRDCHQIASNFPQESLDRNPLSKVFGRHMVFFHCAKKVESRCCGMAQMNKWLEVMFGDEGTAEDYTRFGLPANKYERAALVTHVMYESASPEEEFIGDFFYGKSEF